MKPTADSLLREANMRCEITSLFTLLTFSIFCLGQSPLGKTATLANAVEIRQKLEMSLPKVQVNPVIKIAILDYGFAGFEKEKPCLPLSTDLVEFYDREWIKTHKLGDPEFQKGFEPGNPHGRQMAQTIWSLLGEPANGFQFYLLNANGPTLFKRAIRHAIDNNVNIILFSGHFEGGGNYDGLGSINRAVDEAVKAGIIWVNAAGNHHGRVRNGKIVTGDDGFVRMNLTSNVTTFTNRLDENTLTITLTWNDYKDREDAGTNKDLDFVIEDANGTVIASSQLKQISAERPASEGETKNPRERLTIPNLAKGQYRIRVQDKSKNFTTQDRYRLLIMPSRSDPFPHPDTNKLTNPIDWPDASNSEELFPPADHARVITVGEKTGDSAFGPTSDRRLKPDVLFPAIPARWSHGEVTGGTSYAAAYFAAVVAQNLTVDPSLTTNDWMRWFAQTRKSHVVQKGSIKPSPQPADWKMPKPADWANGKANKR